MWQIHITLFRSIDESQAYLDRILDICRKEKINAVTTLIDPEIELLAKNRARFEEIGVEVLAPYTETAELCFDKFKMYQYLTAHGVPTTETWGDYTSAMEAVESGQSCVSGVCQTENRQRQCWRTKSAGR